MPNVRELEDLIIDAIYLDILRGKLDQKEGQLEVEYTMGRDLEPGKLESILSALQDWYVADFMLIFLQSPNLLLGLRQRHPYLPLWMLRSMISRKKQPGAKRDK